jgi:hypothetical protein
MEKIMIFSIFFILFLILIFLFFFHNFAKYGHAVVLTCPFYN